MDDSIIQVVSHIKDGKNEGGFMLKVHNTNYFHFY